MGARSTLCKWLGCARSPQAAAVPLVGFYGDSLTAGTIEGTPNNTMPVPPVRRMNELADGAFFGISYARPGATAALALEGGHAMPYAPWASHVRQAPEVWMVLRFGGADYVVGTPGDTLRPQVTALVEQARAAGKRPVLVGVPSLLPGIGGVDSLLRDLAAGMGVPFVELAHVAVAPGDQPDGIHPGQGLSDRIAAEMVRQLLPIVREV